MTMRILALARVGASALLVCGLASVNPVASHVHTDADGRTVDWYPPDCCHDRDCRPVTRVEERRNIF